MAGNSSSWRDSVIEIPPPEKKSILEKFKRNQNMPIPHDYFLYTCLEHLKTETSQGRLPVTHGSQALAKINGEDRSSEDASGHDQSGEFESLVSDCLTYYLANNPEMFTDGPIYYEHLMEFVSPLTWLMDEYAAIIEYCFKRQALPYGTEAGGSDWEPLERFFQQKLPQRSQYVYAYLTWFFGESKLEAIDLKSMPPVGRFAPPPGTKFLPNGMVRLPPRSSYDRNQVSQEGGRGRRPAGGRPSAPRSSSGGGGGRSAGGNDRGGNDRGGNDRGGPRPDRGAPRNDRGGNDRGGNDKFRNDRNQSQSQGGGKFDRGPRFLDSNKGHNPAEEADAMQDVKSAIQTLQSSPDMQDYLLKPTNSFFRRMQHQEVAAAGFSSHSEGEGKDRALKILRAPDSGTEEG